MKFTILSTEIRTNNKSGEITGYYCRALGEFEEFGKVKLSTVDLVLHNEKHLKQFAEYIGKELDLDIVVPKPQYALKVV